LYFIYPNATNGAAPTIQIHDKGSIPKYGFNVKYKITATTQAHIEKINWRNDNPKNTLSV